MTAPIQAGAQAPERLTLRIANAPGDSEPLDLDDVSTVTLSVREPGGKVRAWDATILEQTGESILIEHVFDIKDVWEPGQYRIDINLAVTGGVRRAGPAVLVVVA